MSSAINVKLAGKKVSKVEQKSLNRKRRLEKAMLKNVKPLVISAVLSMIFAGLLIYVALNVLPWVWARTSDGIIEGVKWYKSKEMLASDIEDKGLSVASEEVSLQKFEDEYKEIEAVSELPDPGPESRRCARLEYRAGGGVLDLHSGLVLDESLTYKGEFCGRTEVPQNMKPPKGQPWRLPSAEWYVVPSTVRRPAARSRTRAPG